MGRVRRSTAATWGAVTFVVVGILLAVAGAVVVQGVMDDFAAVQASMDRTTERWGSAAEYRPDEQPRLELFMTARQRLAPACVALAADLAVLAEAGPRRDHDARTRVRFLLASFRLFRRVASFYDQRERILLDAGMSRGEYLYLYNLVYFAALQRHPADGPPYRIVHKDSDDATPEIDLHEVTPRELRDRLNVLYLAQVSALDEGVARDPSVDLRRREQVHAERVRMRADTQRLPWQDGLPGDLAAAAEPWLERLDALYDPMCNALEVGYLGD